MRMIRKPSLFSHVLDGLGGAIVAGTYAGGLLPREQDLCVSFGASRTVIREVVRVLAQKGMVEAQQKVGVRILPSSAWNLLDIDVLDWIWRGERHPQYVRDFLEFRLAFEPMASYQAAIRAGVQEKQLILRLCDALVEANERLVRGGDREHAIDCDIAFHTAIYSASGNQLAHYLGALVNHMLRRQIAVTTEKPAFEFGRGLHLHVAVAKAIEAGAADEAFRHSVALVRMPYEAYMGRKFPETPSVHPNLRHEAAVPAA